MNTRPRRARERDESGSMLMSVLVAMVLFGISLPAVIHLHMRATAMSWNARAEQQAVAVAAWHAVEARTGGCDELDADSDADNGYNPPTVTALAGQKLLPPDGFVVACSSGKLAWPPPLTAPAAAAAAAAACTAGEACVLTVTTTWTRLDGTSRALPLRVLTPPP